jgi:hypothetical protein
MVDWGLLKRHATDFSLSPFIHEHLRQDHYAKNGQVGFGLSLWLEGFAMKNRF